MSNVFPLNVPYRRTTEAERRVIRLAERADMIEREKMMHALAKAVVLLKEIAKMDGRCD